MNKIVVYGRVSQDVEIRDVGGRNVASFGVAARNKNKDKNTGEYGTNFYRASAWGATAEMAAKYLKKGHRVTVNGDLVIRDYVGSDGAKHTSVEIQNAEFDLVETRAETTETTAAAHPASPAAKSSSSAPRFTQVESSDPTDELPF